MWGLEQCTRLCLDYAQRKNNTILYRLQAHSSHVTQPLDLSVFGPLKTFNKQANQEYLDNNPCHTIHIFGHYTGVNLARRKFKSRVPGLHAGTESSIGVQPTAIARRKVKLGGRRRLTAGCQTKQAAVKEPFDVRHPPPLIILFVFIYLFLLVDFERLRCMLGLHIPICWC